MKSAINPFRQLYVGESVGPEEFVKLFSPVLVSNSLALFQPGNVVLTGFTGAGKSMLLNLLLPEIRLAYEKSDTEYPIPEQFSRFIGSGINLQTSGVSNFGNRIISKQDAQGGSEAPFYFADFLNYYVVADLLASIEKLASTPEVCVKIGVDFSSKKINDFVVMLCQHDCWFGFLKDVDNFLTLKQVLAGRIVTYKSYLNINLLELPNNIRNTKTEIGQPISIAVRLLRKSGIIASDTQIFVRIDQFEELIWLGTKDGLGNLYQQMIHRLLALRNSDVSYRIGTRHFAWDGDKTIFGTTAPLEKKRNYLEFHLEEEMRRKENARTWLFPKLAEDIFKRRVGDIGPAKGKKKEDILKQAFGNSKTPRETVLIYFAGKKKEKAIEVEPYWPTKWRNYLRKLAATNPFEARLAEAWSRQKGKESVMLNIPDKEALPWEKPYWKKERTEQALIQLASRNQQQLHWSGKDDILALSGGNILTFLSLCRHIWEVWLRDNKYVEDQVSVSTPKFDKIIQSIGIIEASSEWYNEMAVDERGGKNRKRFITFLGTLFFKTLIEDKAMSNPGHNGFSIDLSELSDSKYGAFLRECSDYGDLYDSAHTSKLKDKKKRWKFYLNPILSPYFKIPYVHTKEPMYISIERLEEWLHDADVLLTVEDKARITGKRLRNAKKQKVVDDDRNLKFDF